MDSKKAGKCWTFNVQPLKGTLYGAVTDRCLLLLFVMMRPLTRCQPKRPPTLEVYPSPGSVEFISVSRENGHLVRRQTIKDGKVIALEFHDPALSVDISSLQADIDISSLPTNRGVFQAAEDHSTVPEVDPTSCSALVSMLFYHHITVGSHATDKTHQMAPILSMLSQRGPPPGSLPIRYSLV